MASTVKKLMGQEREWRKRLARTRQVELKEKKTNSEVLKTENSETYKRRLLRALHKE